MQVYVGEDWEAARSLMRPFIASRRWHGRRGKNFYNTLFSGTATRRPEIQDLYLDGKKDEAMAAIPDDLIDAVTLCGPKEHVKERLAAFKEAGVGTLGVTPIAFTKDDRIEQLRLIAELNG